MAFCMTVAMLSLAGIPVTAGFFRKIFCFTTLIGTPYKWLLILAVLTSAIGVYYYLKVVIAMYFKSPCHSENIEIEGSHRMVILVTSLVTLVIGPRTGTNWWEMFRF